MHLSHLIFKRGHNQGWAEAGLEVNLHWSWGEVVGAQRSWWPGGREVEPG